MKCINCNEELDELDTICPKCNTKVIVSNTVDFGDISRTDYSNTSLVINAKDDEPNIKKNKISIVKIIILVVVFLSVTILGMKVIPYIFKSVTHNQFVVVDNWIDEVYEKKSANVDITIKKNNIISKLTGTLKYDLNSPYISLNLKKDTNTDEVIVGNNDKTLDLILNSNGLYFKSNILANQAYYKKLELYSINKFRLKENLKLDQSQDAKINYFNKTIDVKKSSFNVNNYKVSAYYTNDTLYRITLYTLHKNLEIDIEKDKYYYRYLENDINVLSGVISSYKKDNVKTYNISADSKDTLRDIVIKVTYNNEEVSESEFKNAQNIDLMGQKEYIKNLISTTFGF